MAGLSEPVDSCPGSSKFDGVVVGASGLSQQQVTGASELVDGCSGRVGAPGSSVQQIIGASGTGASMFPCS